MTMPDDGIQGAKRLAMNNDVLLNIVLSVIEGRPRNADPYSSQLARRFQEEIENHPDTVDLTSQIFEYFYVNNARRALREKPTKAEREAARERSDARVLAKQREMDNRTDARAHKMFLDMLMPNGKTLRDCTGNDLRKMEPRIAKTMKHLAKTLKPRQKVGDVYTTNEELLAAAKA